MITATMEFITPRLAKEYLEKNTSNYRKLSHTTVWQYANDIENGRWQENGEAIKFDEEGTLVDGQHRLKAIVMANVPACMMVVRGVSKGTQIYDIQRRRTVEQIVKHHITDNSVNNYTISAARTILSFNESNSPSTSPQSRFAPSGEIIQFLEHDIFQLTQMYAICRKGASAAKTRNGFTISALALYCRYSTEEYECGNATYEEVEKFVNIVNSGLPIEGRECSNALVFRNTLYGISNAKYKCYEIASATIMAFRDFLNGVPRNRGYRVTNIHNEYYKKAQEEWDKYQNFVR